MYGALFVLDLAAAGFVIDGTVLRATLGHPFGVSDYVILAWKTTSAAMVGGTLGSGLESNAAVRKAAYGRREQERRAERDSGTDTS